jgi:hypothetical protein
LICFQTQVAFEILSLVEKLKQWLAMKNPKNNEILIPVSKQGDFTPVCRFWASEERQIQDIQLACPKVLAVKIAKPKDVDYEK